MTVFTAMIVDAYRELNSKRLFWIVLALSGMVVFSFASIGFTENGMSMLFGLKEIDNPIIHAGSPVAAHFYKLIFSWFVVGVWLAWIAVILALISTTTVFPDFVAGGAIDIMLSKPIGRVRLFFYKYISSLLFVLLQNTIICVGVFFCMAWRIDVWEWKLFLAIPLITLFYSYLYSINVLVGVWTRSAITALLVTMLFWFSLFGLNASHTVLLQVRTDLQVQIEDMDAAIASPGLARHTAEQIERRKEFQDTIDSLEKWNRPVKLIRSVLPRTMETVDYVDRSLTGGNQVSFTDIMAGNVVITPDGFESTNQSRNRRVEERLTAELREPGVWEIIVPSLLFEFVVLCLACWIFVRRDY